VVGRFEKYGECYASSQIDHALVLTDTDPVKL